MTVHLLVPTFGIPNVEPDEVECSDRIAVDDVETTPDLAHATCRACLATRRARLERELGPNLEAYQ
jgi:hypothetical protein